MDAKTAELVAKWQATLTPKEKQLHEMAAVMLKKTVKCSDMPPDQDKDNGSYYADKCHAFQAWKKEMVSKGGNP